MAHLRTGTSALLKIASLNKSHLLSIFTCQASYSNLSSSSPLQSSITLDLNCEFSNWNKANSIGQAPKRTTN